MYVHEKIQNYASFGDEVNEEKKVLQERKNALLRTAQTEMQSIAADQQATVAQLDEMLEKYKDYPREVQMARDALQSAQKLRLASLTSAMTQFQNQADPDYGALVAAIEKDRPTLEKEEMRQVLADLHW